MTQPKHKIFLIALICIFTAVGVRAQEKESPGKEPAHEFPRFEIFGGYSYLHEGGESFHGWTGTLVTNFNHWFGLAADVDGHYGTHPTALGDETKRIHAFTFGPHVAYRKSKVVPFAFLLFGVAHESVTEAGVTASETGFAMNAGGGIDLEVRENIALRLIQVDAAYTHLGGHSVTSPRVSAGVVFSFGRK